MYSICKHKSGRRKGGEIGPWFACNVFKSSPPIIDVNGAVWDVLHRVWAFEFGNWLLTRCFG